MQADPRSGTGAVTGAVPTAGATSGAVPTTGAATSGAGAEPVGGSLWTAAEGYEPFMGRWSRRLAAAFLDALAVPAGSRWLDVGCGVGSLVAAIVARCAPAAVVGVDPSPAFLGYARGVVAAARGCPTVRLQEGRGEDLPFADGTFDAAVSGLALNFMDDPDAGLREMVRVTRPGGAVGAYVWDYAHDDFFLARFWQAAAEADGAPAPGDERGRWRVCSPAGLLDLAAAAPLSGARVWSIDLATTFRDAEELWQGFLLGVGPTGRWAAGLPPDRRRRVRAHLEARLPVAADGRVELSARALALAGRVPVPA